MSTREQWLTEAVNLLRPMFAEHWKNPNPPEVKVSVGFPSKRPLSLKNRAIGQCWDAAASADGAYTIFVSPLVTDPLQVLGVLIHELVHAYVGTAEGHKGPFKTLAEALGLVGKMTATTVGDELSTKLQPVLQSLGTYPQAEFTPALGGVKKEKTYLLKVACPACEYTIRVTQKWVDVGLPTCPCGEGMEVAS